MKTTTSITIDPEILQQAKKKIENISNHIQKYLENEMELNKAEMKKDKLELANIKIVRLAREVELSLKEIKKLKEIVDKQAIKISQQSAKGNTGWVDI